MCQSAKADAEKIIKEFLEEEDVPGWYRDLSNFQIDGANSLLGSIRDDTLANETSRVRRCLMEMGLQPTINDKMLHFLIHTSGGNDLAFLYFLLELEYKTPQGNTYFEQVILSSIAHLDMISTLRQLDRILPPPQPTKREIEARKLAEENKKRQSEENNRKRAGHHCHPKDQPTLPYFQRLVPPKPYGKRLTISEPAIRVSLGWYEIYQDSLYVVPNESNRWFEVYELGTKNHSAVDSDSISRREIKTLGQFTKDAAFRIVENELSGVCDENENRLTEDCLCGHRRVRKELEASVEHKLKMIARNRCLDCFDVDKRRHEANRKGILDQILEDLATCSQETIREEEVGNDVVNSGKDISPKIKRKQNLGSHPDWRQAPRRPTRRLAKRSTTSRIARQPPKSAPSTATTGRRLSWRNPECSACEGMVTPPPLVPDNRDKWTPLGGMGDWVGDHGPGDYGGDESKSNDRKIGDVPIDENSNDPIDQQMKKSNDEVSSERSNTFAYLGDATHETLTDLWKIDSNLRELNRLTGGKEAIIDQFQDISRGCSEPQTPTKRVCRQSSARLKAEKIKESQHRSIKVDEKLMNCNKRCQSSRCSCKYESDMFFHASSSSMSPYYDHEKIFNDIWAKEPESLDIKKIFMKALDVDVGIMNSIRNYEITVDKIIDATIRKYFKDHARKVSTEEASRSTQEKTVEPKNVYYDPDDKDLMQRMLKNALNEMKKNPKYVLASLKDAHKLPILRQWIYRRFGKEYTRQELVEDYGRSCRVFLALEKLEFHLNIPSGYDLNSPSFVSYNTHDYILQKSLEIRNNFLKSVTAEVLERQRVFCLAMNPFIVNSGSRIGTYFTYLPARYQDSLRFRPWQPHEFFDTRFSVPWNQFKI